MYGHWRVCLNLHHDVSLLQEGVAALYAACQGGYMEVAKLLLEHGAQVDLPTDVSHVLLIRRSVSVCRVTYMCCSYSFNEV